MPSRVATILAIGTTAALALVAAAGPLTDRGTQPPLVYPLKPADECGGCHGDFDRTSHHEPWTTWAGSMMANATRDPLFWAALDVANADQPGIGTWCLRCHTPRGFLAGRTEPPGGTADGCGLLGLLDDPLEGNDNDFAGVGCDMCHRMTPNLAPPPGQLPIYLENAQFWLDDGDCGGVGEPCAHGPYRYPEDGDPPVHAWAESTYHEDSAICGNCHNVTSPLHNLLVDGVDAGIRFPIERTYREWSQSAFATPGPAAVQCQGCHMPDTTTSPAHACRLSNNDHSGDLPIHQLAGGNAWIPEVLRLEYPALGRDRELAATRDWALEMLQNRSATAMLTVPSTVVAGSDLALDVQITNLTGHKLPTGYPEGRRMWIHVEARDGLGNPWWDSGAYDPVSAVLASDPQLKVYEAKPGIWNLLGGSQCDTADGMSRPLFHFVRNDCYALDNRIPPLGFTGMNDPETRPVAATYPETMPGSGILVNWDTTTYTIPVPPGIRAPVTVVATLHYQTASREYVEFLRDEAINNGSPPDCLARTTGPSTLSRGAYLYDLWSRYDRSPPVPMASAAGGANVLDASCPSLPGAAGDLLAVREGPGGADVRLRWTGGAGASTHSVYRVRSDAQGTAKARVAVASAITAATEAAVELTAGCGAVVGSTCVDAGAVPMGPALLLYRAVGACDNGSEGPS